MKMKPDIAHAQHSVTAEFGKVYEVWIPGEPLPKTTQRPPRGPKAYWIVQTDKKYARLKRTWQYQRHIANCAWATGFPHFDSDDPVMLSATIYKSRHKTGDTKNVIAALEDGLVFGGFIPDDRQVTGYGGIDVVFNVGKDKAGVHIAVQIDPRVTDLKWLTGWIGSKKKAAEYQQRRGIHG